MATDTSEPTGLSATVIEYTVRGAKSGDWR